MAEADITKLTLGAGQDSNRWFGDRWSSRTKLQMLVHYALALAGEAGELANIVKKIDRGSILLNDAVTRNKLTGELTDVLVYLLNIANLLNIDLSRAYEQVRGQNNKRFLEERKARENGI